MMTILFYRKGHKNTKKKETIQSRAIESLEIDFNIPSQDRSMYVCIYLSHVGGGGKGGFLLQQPRPPPPPLPPLLPRGKYLRHKIVHLPV